MRRAVVLSLLLASGAKASVMLPPDLIAEAGVPALAWQAGQQNIAAASGAVEFAAPAAAVTSYDDTTILPLSVVPDTTSWSLLLLGMAIVGLAARRRQRSVAA